MSLRVLGSGARPRVDAAVEAEKAYHLAQDLSPLERRYVEHLCLTNGDERAALFHAWPAMSHETPYAIHNALRSLRRKEAVVAYGDALMGAGALQSMLGYATMLERLYDEANDPRTPARERAQLLIALTEHLYRNGVAAAEGFQGGGRVAEKTLESSAVSKADQDMFMRSLTTYWEPGPESPD